MVSFTFAASWLNSRLAHNIPKRFGFVKLYFVLVANWLGLGERVTMNVNGNTNGNGHLPGQFPPANIIGQTELPATLARTKPKPSRIHQRNQAATLQRFAYDAALALRTACTNKESGVLTMTPAAAKAIKELVGAWDTARDAVRVLRGKGLPASVRSKPGRSAAQVEPLIPA